jgi:hypothetical protein
MKIVINDCFGGYGLSEEAYNFMGYEWDGHGYDYSDDRSNPKLVKCIETLGKDANGSCAELRIVDVPDNIDWYIEEYDGVEHIAEKHRTWG